MTGAKDLPTIGDLAALEELVDAQRPATVYLRVSRGPEADAGSRSRDYESGLELPGLSVSVATPPDWWTRPGQDWLARRLCSYDHLLEESDEERIVWLCTGREAGSGPDHEPLLVDVAPLAVVTSDCIREGRRRYRERFDVGRDSTGNASEG